MQKTNWIWTPEWNAEDKDEPRIVYFRKAVRLNGVPKKLEIRISADSRYKLYVNEKLAETGPCKGDNQIWYYDTVDLAPYLVTGDNIIAIEVLRYPMERNKGCSSIFRTDTPGLYVKGEYSIGNGEVCSLSADESWKCKRNYSIKIIPGNPILDHLYFTEEASGDPLLSGWKRADYSDEDWEAAKPLFWELVRKISEGQATMRARPIPYMNKIPRRFYGIQKIRSSSTSGTSWNQMLEGYGTVTVPANSTEAVEISAGEEMTGFLKLSLIGGRDAEIKILQSESYYVPKETEEGVRGKLEKRTDLTRKTDSL